MLFFEDEVKEAAKYFYDIFVKMEWTCFEKAPTQENIEEIIINLIKTFKESNDPYSVSKGKFTSIGKFELIGTSRGPVLRLRPAYELQYKYRLRIEGNEGIRPWEVIEFYR